MTKQTITFVGKSYATIGFKFFFDSPRTDICPKNCRFYAPCMENLDQKTIYSVIENQRIVHECPSSYHDEPMVLVKVDEGDIQIIMETKRTFEGAVITYEPIKCEEENCPYLDLCSPIKGILPGSKVKIIEIVNKINDNECSDKKLSIVKIKKA